LSIYDVKHCWVGEGALPARSVAVVPAGLDRPNHGVLVPPPPPPVVIPPFSAEQLNNAAVAALERIRQRLEFVSSLFANNVIVQVGTLRWLHVNTAARV
jgi:hypothetical protein